MKATYTEDLFIEKAKITLKHLIDADTALRKKAEDQDESLLSWAKKLGYASRDATYLTLDARMKFTDDERMAFSKEHGGSFHYSFSPHDGLYENSYVHDKHIETLRGAIAAALFAEKVELGPEDGWMIAEIE